jgi:hypothetical protein
MGVTKVKQLRIAVILIVMAVLPVSLRAQNTGTAANQGAGQAGNPAVQGNVLRITSPKGGERLRQNFANIQYELINGGASAAGVPNFAVKLDSQDPVTTNSTNYIFSGLTPGAHTVTVQLVDANGTPVAGARSEVQFVVVQPAAPTPGGTIALRHRLPSLISASLRVDGPREQAKDEPLPSAAGALPLLSVIGFGVLLGGIASAMRTRPK